MDAVRLSERIGCRLKLYDLHVLMTVVQAGSMSKAAAVLSTGQPAISRSISELERELGVRLLDRGRQGVKPTEYGRALLEGGTAVFDDTYWAMAGATNPWTRRRTIDLAELANEAWALPPPESTTGSVALAAFRAIRLDYPRTTVIAEPVDVRITMLATGRFVTIFPESVFRFSARRPEIKLLPVRQRLSRLPVGIITLRNRTISPLAQEFIASSREVAKQLMKGRDSGRNVS